MEPGVALSALAAKDDAVAVPLLDGGTSARCSPWR
jgi:hypothetical protein